MILCRSKNDTAWVVRPTFMTRSRVALAFLLLLAGTSLSRATDPTATFQIPPVKIPLDVKDQQLTIASSALIAVTRDERGLNTARLQLNADLSEVQHNLTGVLSSALDKIDGCGDHIRIQSATLTPLDPATQAVVALHYERWECAMVVGKKQAKRVTSGNALVEMKLTPAVEANNSELRLVPDVGRIEADGSFGEFLRSGTLGDMLRDKIRSAILSTLQKATDLSATLPPALQGHARIQNAQFQDAGEGRLAVHLQGEFPVTEEQVEFLSDQVKQRIASR
jgi:hypothetical protein